MPVEKLENTNWDENLPAQINNNPPELYGIQCWLSFNENSIVLIHATWYYTDSYIQPITKHNLKHSSSSCTRGMLSKQLGVHLVCLTTHNVHGLIPCTFCLKLLSCWHILPLMQNRTTLNHTKRKKRIIGFKEKLIGYTFIN